MSSTSPAAPAPGAGAGDAAATAAQLGAEVLQLVVDRATSPAPSVRQLHLVTATSELPGFSPRPGQDLMVEVDPAGRSGRPLRRRYTIRSFDPAAATITLQIVLHGDGPGMRWASEARPGTSVTAIGPRGKIWPVSDAPWHGFIGDDTFLPAASSMIEGRPEGSTAWGLIEVDSPADALRPDDPSIPIRFLNRGNRPPGEPGGLLDALASLELPPGPGHVYVGGELRVVAAIRRLLLARGLADEQLSTKPYWRHGRANQAHGEPEKD